MFKRKGGGVKGLLNNVKKKLHFSYTMASLTIISWYLLRTYHTARRLKKQCFLGKNKFSGQDGGLGFTPLVDGFCDWRF